MITSDFTHRRGVRREGTLETDDETRRQRLRRKLRALRRSLRKGTLTETELQDRCTSLFAHVKHADDAAWRKAVLTCLEGDAGEWN